MTGFSQWQGAGNYTENLLWREVWNYLAEHVLTGTDATQAERYRDHALFTGSFHALTPALRVVDIFLAGDPFAMDTYFWGDNQVGSGGLRTITALNPGTIERSDNFFWNGPFTTLRDVQDYVEDVFHGMLGDELVAGTGIEIIEDASDKTWTINATGGAPPTPTPDRGPVEWEYIRLGAVDLNSTSIASLDLSEAIVADGEYELKATDSAGRQLLHAIAFGADLLALDSQGNTPTNASEAWSTAGVRAASSLTAHVTSIYNVWRSNLSPTTRLLVQNSRGNTVTVTFDRVVGTAPRGLPGGSGETRTLLFSADNYAGPGGTGNIHPLEYNGIPVTWPVGGEIEFEGWSDNPNSGPWGQYSLSRWRCRASQVPDTITSTSQTINTAESSQQHFFVKPPWNTPTAAQPAAVVFGQYTAGPITRQIWMRDPGTTAADQYNLRITHIT